VAVFDRRPDGSLGQKPGQDGCAARHGNPLGCRPVNGIDAGVEEGPLALRFSPGPEPANLYVGTFDGALLTLDRDAAGVLTQRPGTPGCVRDDGLQTCFNATALGTGAIRQIDVSPDGRHVYVPAAATAGVTVFDRSATGTLTQKPDLDGCLTATGSPVGGQNQCARVPALAGDGSTLELSPDGRHLYVGADNRLVVFNRDGGGRLSFASCFNRAGDLGCSGGGRNMTHVLYLGISPDGEDLVAGSFDGNGLAFFHRNGADGRLSQTAGPDGCISSTGAATDSAVVTPGACRAQRAISADGHITFVGADQLYAGFIISGAVHAFKRDFAPRCDDRSASVVQDTAVSVPLTCTDRNGDPFTLAIAGSPTAGQLGAIDSAAARVFYNPFGGFSGADSFKYRAVAGGQASNDATVSLTVTPQPATPPTGRDADRDGFFAGQDCNDNDAAIRPGAREIRGNRVDENCDGLSEPFATIAAGVSTKWDVQGTRFTLTQLTISQAPRGAKLELRCAGRGCPFARRTLTGKTRRGMLNAFPSLGKRVHFRAKQTLEIRVSANGFNTKVAQLKLVKGKIPTTVPLCLPPGGTRLQRTCN
jgi:hypothetical protein